MLKNLVFKSCGVGNFYYSDYSKQSLYDAVRAETEPSEFDLSYQCM